VGFDGPQKSGRVFGHPRVHKLAGLTGIAPPTLFTGGGRGYFFGRLQEAVSAQRAPLVYQVSAQRLLGTLSGMPAASAGAAAAVAAGGGGDMVMIGRQIDWDRQS